MTEYTIITSQFKFQISNFTQSIDNKGGFPIVKYTAHPVDGSSLSYCEHIVKNPPPPGTIVTATGSHNIICNPGTEILVIGDSVHFLCFFNELIMNVTPGILTNFIQVEI